MIVHTKRGIYYKGLYIYSITYFFYCIMCTMYVSSLFLPYIIYKKYTIIMRSISIIIRFEAEKKKMMVVKFFSRRNTFMHTAIGNVLLS